MPLSDVCQDCQVNCLLCLETAAADLVRQCETTNKLVKRLLERLGPPQAENTRFATRSPFHVPFSCFINDTRTFRFSCALRPFHLFRSCFC